MSAEIIDINDLRFGAINELYRQYGSERTLKLLLAEGDLAGFRYMVETCGADPFKYGNSALYDAIRNDQQNVLSYLLDMVDLDYDLDGDDDELLCVGAEEGSPAMVGFLIDEVGCDFKVSDGGPLLYAAREGRLDNLRFMIETYHLFDAECLHLILEVGALNGYLNIVRYLLEEVGVDMALNDYVAVQCAWDSGHARVAAWLSRYQLMHARR